MTGLGEEVYEDRSAALNALTSESERLGLYGASPYSANMMEEIAEIIASHTAVPFQPNMGGIWAAVSPGHKRRASDAAHSVLESISIPLTVLAALRSGEWVAVPREMTEPMIDAKLGVCDGGLEDEANRDWTRAEWAAAIDAAPKSPSEDV